MKLPNLNNPDTRRAVRTVLETGVALVLLYFVNKVLDRVTDFKDLTELAKGSLLIVGLGTFFYGAENVTRAVKISTPFGSAEVGDDDNDATK